MGLAWGTGVARPERFNSDSIRNVGLLSAVTIRCAAVSVPGLGVIPLDAFRQPGDAYDPIIGIFQLQKADALRVPPDLSDVVHLAAQDLALRRHAHDFILVPNF